VSRPGRIVLVVASVALASCADLKNAITPPTIAEVAPEPVTPLASPTVTMKGAHGDAGAAYPPDFAATVKADGTILFPQHTQGRIQGSSLLVGGETVLTVGADGSLKGPALKRHYAFGDDGSLLDDDGHGVRILPDGSIRAVKGAWRSLSIFSWTTDKGDPWDKHAWRTLAIVALVVVENMLPAALRPDGDSKADAGKDKGLDIHIPPPSQWFK